MSDLREYAKHLIQAQSDALLGGVGKQLLRTERERLVPITVEALEAMRKACNSKAQREMILRGVGATTQARVQSAILSARPQIEESCKTCGGA